MVCLVAGQYEDIMSWIRAMYSRRELVFSLVEKTCSIDDDDVSVAMIDDSGALVTGSSIRQTATPQRRNASLKVRWSLMSLICFI